MEKHILFCFPYAGGASTVFRKWKSCLHPDIALRAVELASRGSRIKVAPYRNFRELIDDVYLHIKDEILQHPFYFFGHSMGCKIAHELTLKLIRKGMPLPEHLFLSGRGAPHIKRKDQKVYSLMADDEFKSEVLHLGGTPPEFFQYPELLELFLPLLKNDFKLTEENSSSHEMLRIDRPITVLLGKQDDQTQAEADGWKEHTTRECDIHYFDGGHFFLNEEHERIVEMVHTVHLRRMSALSKIHN